MAITVDIKEWAKYNDVDLTPEQQTALSGKIKSFLEDTKTEPDLPKDDQTAKAFTLFDFQFTGTGPKLAVDFTVTKFTGAEPTRTAEVSLTSIAEPQTSASVPQINVLSGAEGFVDDKTHVGIAVELTSSGKTSVLTIPDIGAVKSGESPVYITKPIKLELARLNKFLKNKKVTLPDEVSRLLNDTSLSCDAFYFTANGGPLLMFFQLQFTKGLIASLTGDPDIGELFDIKSAAVRVLRCPNPEALKVLQDYAEELRDERALPPAS